MMSSLFKKTLLIASLFFLNANPIQAQMNFWHTSLALKEIWPLDETLTDLIVESGVNRNLAASSTPYYFKNVNIKAGGTLTLTGEGIVFIASKNDFIVDGVITAAQSLTITGGNFTVFDPVMKKTFTAIRTQQLGGNGANGGNSSGSSTVRSPGSGGTNNTTGIGGGGGGGGAQGPHSAAGNGGNGGANGGSGAKGLNGDGGALGSGGGVGAGSDGTSITQKYGGAGGSGASGGGGGGGGTYSSSAPGSAGGGGGGGGYKGKHIGVSLVIRARSTFSGLGTITLAGTDGFRGGNGGNPSNTGGNYGGCGGGGGGGAGGNSADVYVYYRTSTFNPDNIFNVSGKGGKGGVCSGTTNASLPAGDGPDGLGGKKIFGLR